jgi:hypothetical protein
VKTKSLRAIAFIILCVLIGYLVLRAYLITSDTTVWLLNPPEERETLNFVLYYPSNSSLFPIIPIMNISYIRLEIQLEFMGFIAERQPVVLAVSGFMTPTMANKTDRVFVEFRGAVPYNDNETSEYGPSFSGVILTEDRIDQGGHVLLTNQTETIVWNVQGYFNPVVIVMNKSFEIQPTQEYSDFPVYVNGYSDLQQVKLAKIGTNLAYLAMLIAVLLGIEPILKLIRKTKDEKKITLTISFS